MIYDFVADDLVPLGPEFGAPVLAQIALTFDLVADDLVPLGPDLDEAEAPIVFYQSYSQVIRDALFAKAVQLPFFQGWVARRSKQLQIQPPQDIPYLGVYIIEEQMGPDGDANAGDIRFVHSLRIGFQVIILNNDPVKSELKLDAAFWALMNGLWRDPKLTNFINSDMPDNTRIEGVTRGNRTHHWGSGGLDNELPYGELQYDAWISYRTNFAPIITDDLNRIHVETVPTPSGELPPDGSEVQRIITEYEFTTTRLKHGGRNVERPPRANRT